MNNKEQELFEAYKNTSQEVLDNIFLSACFQGDLEQAKFVLSYPKLKNHADIHVNDDVAFSHVCSGGHLEIVKYLLSSNELKDKINIHTQNDMGFRQASVAGNLDIIRYFIFDCDIKKNHHINEYLNRKPNQEIENMFKIRELNKSLKKELGSNEELNKKLKL
jgi:hypothetical protein